MSRYLLDRYGDDIGRYRPLSCSEKDRLIERLRSGDETARRELVQTHLWLVVHEARRYRWQGVEMIDLIQEGNLGLLHAAKKFDPHRGTQFSTYAIWWIRQALRRAWAKVGLPVYLPEYIFTGKFLKLARLEKELARELGFTPPWQLTILMTDYFTDRERGEFWYCWFARLPVSVELRQKYKSVEMEAQSLMRCLPEFLSLELEIPEMFARGYSFDHEPGEPDLQLGEVIADLQQPEEEVEEKFLCQDMQQTLSKIPRRESEVLKHRWGLEEQGSKTITEFSLNHGLSRSQFHTIEARALSMLRHPTVQRRVHSYLDDGSRFADLHLVAGEVWNDAGELPSTVAACPDEVLDAAYGSLLERYRAELGRWQNMSRTELMSELRLRLKPAGRQPNTLKNWVNDYLSPGRSRRKDEDVPANFADDLDADIDF